MRLAPILAALLLLANAPVAAGCGDGLAVKPGGYLFDAAAGLYWTQCLVGQGDGGCVNPALAFSWVDALNTARGFERAGIARWRMPTIDEIETLFANIDGCAGEFFPRLQAAIVWSASANIDYATDAWAFDIGTGKRVVHARDSRRRLLLVADIK